MKSIFKALILLIMILSIAFSALALPELDVFTHPEIGEQMTVSYEAGTPYFQIYGFYYYRFMGISAPYRGITNTLDYSDLEKREDSNSVFSKIYTSISENNEEGAKIIDLTFTHGYEKYKDLLINLERESYVEKIQDLFGFNGIEAYNNLLLLDGVSEADVSQLVEGYVEYSVNIGGINYPYRLFVQYIEEEKWFNSYFEKYSFIKVGETWRLLNITREYTDEYKERSKYIHGLSPSNPDEIKESYEELLSGLEFGIGIEEASTILKANLRDDNIVEGLQIYFLPVKTELLFENEALSKITYRLESLSSFYSSFVSLYLRYIDPVMILTNGDMTWSLDDILIKLKYNEGSPTLEIEPIL